MTQKEIKELDDSTLVKKLMEELGVDKLKNLSEKIGVPFATMNKWKCKNGIPTVFPQTGGYKILFQSLLFIEMQNKELNELKAFFKSFSNLSKKYQ